MDANALIAQSQHSLIVRSINMREGEHDAPHQHPWHQVLLPGCGVLKTRTQHKEYYVPFNRAVLIPANCQHESWAITAAEFIGVYVEADQLPWLSKECRIIELSPLYRELIMHLVETTTNIETPSSHDKELASVFCHLTAQQAEVDFELILPQDHRALLVADRLLQNPGLTTTLKQWADIAGASEKTLSRLFENETGLSFSQWRQRLRLYHSLTLLEQKTPIHSIALSIGYNSASAFIHRFKQEFGTTPQRYFN